MEAYKRWVRRNKDHLHSFDYIVNGITWVLPDLLCYSEIAPEAVTSIFDTITTINLHIIKTNPAETAGLSELSWSPYSLCIALIEGLEMLVEIAAQHYYGDDKKWNFIAGTEAIKLFVRLAMFCNSGYQMLLCGGESVNVQKVRRNLESKALSALNRFGENARVVCEPSWLRSVQQATIVQKRTLFTLLSEEGIPGALFLMGEMLFFIRPLLYVLLVRKYGTRSWFPWFTSLAVDLIGYVISYRAKWSRKEEPLFRLSDRESDELSRRKILFVLYLMRDPLFTKYTRTRLERTQNLLQPVPAVGFLADRLIELIIVAQKRYTYISGS